MLSKLICTAALAVWGVVTAYAAPVLSVMPSLTNVFVGNSFTVNINIEDVSDLYAWQLDVSYGPAGLLGATTQTVGGFLGGGQTFGGGTADDSLATITAMFSSLSGPLGVSGSGVLASLSFQALFEGSAAISLFNLQLLDSNLDSIFTGDARSARVNITRQPGTDVPEPSTFALLGLALACASWPRRSATSSRVFSAT